MGRWHKSEVNMESVSINVSILQKCPSTRPFVHKALSICLDPLVNSTTTSSGTRPGLQKVPTVARMATRICNSTYSKALMGSQPPKSQECMPGFLIAVLRMLN